MAAFFHGEVPHYIKRSSVIKKNGVLLRSIKLATQFSKGVAKSRNDWILFRVSDNNNCFVVGEEEFSIPAIIRDQLYSLLYNAPESPLYFYKDKQNVCVKVFLYITTPVASGNACADNYMQAVQLLRECTNHDIELVSTPRETLSSIIGEIARPLSDGKYPTSLPQQWSKLLGIHSQAAPIINKTIYRSLVIEFNKGACSTDITPVLFTVRKINNEYQPEIKVVTEYGNYVAGILMTCMLAEHLLANCLQSGTPLLPLYPGSLEEYYNDDNRHQYMSPEVFEKFCSEVEEMKIKSKKYMHFEGCLFYEPNLDHFFETARLGDYITTRSYSPSLVDMTIPAIDSMMVTQEIIGSDKFQNALDVYNHIPVVVTFNGGACIGSVKDLVQQNVEEYFQTKRGGHPVSFLSVEDLGEVSCSEDKDQGSINKWTGAKYTRWHAQKITSRIKRRRWL